MNAVRFIFAVPFVTSIAGGGCKAHPAAPASAMPQASATQPAVDVRKQAYWQEETLPLAQSAVAVTQGPTPLVHIFIAGGPIRVVDLSTGAKLAAVTVADNTLVRVDDRNGVIVGSDNVLPGPLPPGHQYGIYADPTTPNVMRRGIGPPGDRPR